MQDERNAVACVDFAQPADVEAWRGDIAAVQVADGDGQGVDARFGDEPCRLPDIGEDVGRGGIARAFAAEAGVAHASQLGLDVDAGGVCEPGDHACLGDVLFQRQAGAVEHHRIESCADGADAGFGALSVVEVHGDGDLGAACRLQEDGGHQLHGRPRKLYLGELQDERCVQLFGRSNGSHYILDAQAVECPHGVVPTVGVPYDLSERG